MTTSVMAPLHYLPRSTYWMEQLISQCQQRHRHDEWLKFLKKIDRETPKDKALHLIADNYATHKHPERASVRWRSIRASTCTSRPLRHRGSNRVERFFRDISENRLRRGVIPQRA